VSIYSKIVSYQRRSDLYMKARGFGLCIGSIGSIGSGRIWAYRDIDVHHRSWGLFQYIPRTSVIVIWAARDISVGCILPIIYKHMHNRCGKYASIKQIYLLFMMWHVFLCEWSAAKPKIKNSYDVLDIRCSQVTRVDE
jgi:hypothetical protein